MNDRSRPSGTASETPTKKSELTVPRRTVRRRATDAERRLRREREFAADVVAYLEQLDRRRDAEWRLQPISDFIDAA